ncbi:MAG TPA: polysaccharide biosynthesis protein, partial [Albitalea sp.]|nr:polysaccharide biosynthesis protein [Albitalea sp.]
MAETGPAPSTTVWHRLDRALARIRPHRQPLSLLIDGVVIGLCWNFTYLFRLGFERWWTARPGYDLWVMAGVTAVYLATFAAARIPRGMWRFSGFGEVKRLTIACAIAGLVNAVLVLMLQLREVPRAVLALHPVVSLMGLCMVRVMYRMLYEHARWRITGSDAELRRAIVLGAGEAARLLLAGLHQQGWLVLGLLDDDPAKRGARILGTPVLGTLEDVKRPELTAGATHIITAMPGATAAQRRHAIELASATGLPVLTVPSFSELREGTARIERVRAIEPEDLLGRDPVSLDEAGVAQLLSGKTVLVTGAGGSI